MGYAPLAVVTAASSGIGLELARLFAADGYDLFAVADEAAMHGVAREQAGGGRRVEPGHEDVRDDGAAQRVYDVASSGGSRVPGAVAFNLGIGRAGRFIGGDVRTDLSIVGVNLRSTVYLAKLVLRDMSKADDGRALFTGPTNTSFFQRAAMQDTLLARLPFTEDPGNTANNQGCDAMPRGEQKVVASRLISKLTLLGVLPDSLKASGNRLLTKPVGEH